jgi:hypothetical protein
MYATRDPSGLKTGHVAPTPSRGFAIPVSRTTSREARPVAKS